MRHQPRHWRATFDCADPLDFRLSAARRITADAENDFAQRVSVRARLHNRMRIFVYAYVPRAVKHLDGGASHLTAPRKYESAHEGGARPTLLARQSSRPVGITYAREKHDGSRESGSSGSRSSISIHRLAAASRVNVNGAVYVIGCARFELRSFGGSGTRPAGRRVRVVR